MGSFNLDLLKRYMKGAYKDISTIVETGTCQGVGTEAMARVFDRVYTIELDESLHLRAQERLASMGFENITYLQGDSAERLRELVGELEEPAVFFLDAHWSGDASVDWDSSAWKGFRFDTAHTGGGQEPSGPQQVPLDREFDIIARHFPHRCIVYVDDLDKFDKRGQGLKGKCFEGEDWSHLSLDALKATLGDRVDGWNIKRSQLVVRVKPSA